LNRSLSLVFQATPRYVRRKMALYAASILPITRLPSAFAVTRIQFSVPTLSRIRSTLSEPPSLTFLPALSLFPHVGSLLRDIWESVLRAVPKQRTSHSKSRHRRMAGKALKDLIAVVKCPSCGRPKRSHYLCPYCVHATKMYWKSLAESDKGSEGKETQKTWWRSSSINIPGLTRNHGSPQSTGGHNHGIPISYESQYAFTVRWDIASRSSKQCLWIHLCVFVGIIRWIPQQ